MGHYIEVCPHGTMISQCRCPDPSKPKRVASHCPPSCKAQAETTKTETTPPLVIGEDFGVIQGLLRDAIALRSPVEYLNFLNRLKSEAAKSKYTPDRWLELTGIQIMDPDGWDRSSPANFEKDWATPLTYPEFINKVWQSTSNLTNMKPNWRPREH